MTMTPKCRVNGCPRAGHIQVPLLFGKLEITIYLCYYHSQVENKRILMNRREHCKTHPDMQEVFFPTKKKLSPKRKPREQAQ